MLFRFFSYFTNVLYVQRQESLVQNPTQDHILHLFVKFLHSPLICNFFFFVFYDLDILWRVQAIYFVEFFSVLFCLIFSYD